MPTFLHGIVELKLEKKCARLSDPRVDYSFLVLFAVMMLLRGVTTGCYSDVTNVGLDATGTIHDRLDCDQHAQECLVRILTFFEVDWLHGLKTVNSSVR